ncbi:uncharacterized protein LOC124687536 isoform X1 [Lolium rigidum]|uniref:uncharacterized protein LOC124687536 isoform X1 n=1 Tax=Lolium rigidum TaxID=89674 RepID=UPI001F5DA93A|nr:uncharacterized protein LOC124687536 isoform X1 [Lolium rigidum]
MAPVISLLLLVLFCCRGANGRQQNTTAVSLLAPDEEVSCYAVYNSYTRGSNHYGVIATMDVYGFSITQDQDSGAAIWVGNPGDGAPTSGNFILVGWHVKPRLYGDSNTHLFVYWTKDGFQKTGCYNTVCIGFQPEAAASISAGDIITPSKSITIKVFQNKDTGDWWVYCGSNGSATAVGHFPKWLFTGLANSTADFSFGGYVSNEKTAKTPPMGSGSSQPGQAASFSGLQYVLQDGTVSPITGDLVSRTDKKSCYPVTSIVDGKFYYGGPGGCTV